MADILWILFIAAIYFIIIRPMFQGAANSPNMRRPVNKNQNQKPSSPNDKDKFDDGDYVDYEDVK